jgi:hypothetical protein
MRLAMRLLIRFQSGFGSLNFDFALEKKPNRFKLYHYRHDHEKPFEQGQSK